MMPRLYEEGYDDDLVLPSLLHSNGYEYAATKPPTQKINKVRTRRQLSTEAQAVKTKKAQATYEERLAREVAANIRKEKLDLILRVVMEVKKVLVVENDIFEDENGVHCVVYLLNADATALFTIPNENYQNFQRSFVDKTYKAVVKKLMEKM